MAPLSVAPCFLLSVYDLNHQAYSSSKKGSKQDVPIALQRPFKEERGNSRYDHDPKMTKAPELKYEKADEKRRKRKGKTVFGNFDEGTK